MRILFVNTAPLVLNGLGQALLDVGEEVFFVCLDSEDSLLPYLMQYQPDMVFNDGGINRMEKIFPLLDDYNIPHLYWAIEDPISFRDLSLPYALKSALVFTPCVESIAAYRQRGIEARLLMFACHPRFHKQVEPEAKYKHDLVFIGNNYDYHPARNEGVKNILQPLLHGGYDLNVYGNEWWLDKQRGFYVSPEHYKGYLPNNCLPEVCASASIVLGLHSVKTSRTMMSMRTFEILGCGGFFLTQWTPAIEYYFKNHHHLVWSKSAEETRELVDYYLPRPELRKQIARQGQAEVYEKHTYGNRVKEILPLLRRTLKNKTDGNTQSRQVKILKGKTFRIDLR